MFSVTSHCDYLIPIFEETYTECYDDLRAVVAGLREFGHFNEATCRSLIFPI